MFPLPNTNYFVRRRGYLLVARPGQPLKGCNYIPTPGSVRFPAEGLKTVNQRIGDGVRITSKFKREE